MAGRPSVYSEKVLEQTRKYFENYESTYDSPITVTKDGQTTEVMQERANKPPSIRRLAKELGITRDTIYDWKKKHKPFSDILEKHYKDTMTEACIDNGLLGLYNSAFTKFCMQNLVGWQDKSSNETKLTVDIPTKITIEIVRPKDAPANT